MKKINLKGISEILSEKELKNVMGGTGDYWCNPEAPVCSSTSDCRLPGIICMAHCSNVSGGRCI